MCGMSRNFKITAAIALVIIVLLFVTKGLHVWPFAQEVCPPDKCRIYKTGPDGQPIGVSFPEETGRTHNDFAPLPPPGLPEGMPIDPKPITVVSSYVESVQGDEASGNGHAQITYVYRTTQRVLVAFEKFKHYLQDKGYSVSSNTVESSQLTYTLSGHKIVGDKTIRQFNEAINISIAVQDQFANMVRISVIFSGIKNQ